MQIEALYQQGRVEFLKPIQLKRDRFKMIVELPDDEVMEPPPGIDAVPSGATLAPSALDRLLGEYPDDPWLRRMKAIEAEVLAMPEEHLPALTPKQQAYLEAFALREDR